MNLKTLVGIAVIGVALAGCTFLQQAVCAPACRTQGRVSSSLVNFLYPNGGPVPPADTIPELHVPLRVGLAFLPSQSAYGPAALDGAQKERLLERIKERFSSRRFVAEIVVIPDYYLANVRGFDGLDGVERLYHIDVMALVSYDQVMHTDDNKLSLGYLTIVGAYVLRGSSQDSATLVDLAVVDPLTHSLILRAGGTATWHGTSTLIDAERNARKAGAAGFDAATEQMIGHFDSALTSFERDVHDGKAGVRVVSGDATTSRGGMGSANPWELLSLLVLVACRVASNARGAQNGRQRKTREPT